jgi:serine/threonine protein phosphatase PrpC
MNIGYITDRGIRRPKNEDSVKVMPEQNFFMLADGVGGNKSGEVASQATLDFLEDYVNNNPLDEVEGSENMFRYFENAVNYVNECILQLSKTRPEYAGMATTLVFAYVDGRILYVANVGDSRVYFIHGDEIHQITEDHTYVNDLVRMGAITRDEAEHHYKKNVITRAIGANAYNNPDCYNIYVEPDDKILICSDGLYDELSEQRILEEMSGMTDMQECAEKLVDAANDHGGSDNISVICINMVED